MSMSRALVTFGTGPLAPLRALTLPAMAAYAARHGYTLVADRLPTIEPPSWGKLSLLLDVLATHDAALWLDADVLVLDRSEDLAGCLRPGHAAAMAAHMTTEGRVPNAGVWYLTRQAVPLLLEALALYPVHRDHRWWEQAAVIDRLQAGWDQVTTWLDPAWNRHPHDSQPSDRVRFLHLAGLPDRLARLRTVVELVQPRT